MIGSTRKGWGWAAAAAWSWLGCSTAPPPAPSSTPTVTPPPAAPGPAAPVEAPRGPAPAQLAAPTSADRGCEVAVRTRVAPLGDGRYELIASAGNETERPLEVELLYDCPGTPARFDGLPEGYDVGDRCRAGACAAGAVSRQTLALPPGGSREIARVTLDPRAGPCNRELPEGDYSIGATVRLQGAQSCSTSRGTFRHVVRSALPAQVPARPAPVRRPLPAPAPSPAPAKPREKPCPAMACRYTPCPPGVKPPEGCAAVCGCTGQELLAPPLITAPAPPR